MATLLGDDLSFAGLTLTTHRGAELGADVISYFQYEALIAAIAIFFFRSTVITRSESSILKWCCSLLLGLLAYWKKSYELIIAVEIFSYILSFLIVMWRSANVTPRSILVRLMLIPGGAAFSLVLAKLLLSGAVGRGLAMVTPAVVQQGIEYLLPIKEYQAAYNILAAFADPVILQKQLGHLLFVTLHIQIGIGFLGIDFLKREQNRRNELIRLDLADKDDGKDGAASTRMDRARRFQKGAAPFIIYAALPYMIQIITYGNINNFAFACVRDDLHRTVRLNELFDHDNHLTSMALESPTSPDAYATSMDSVVSTAYDIVNRKLFSLPKVLLLPTVMAKQPMLLVSVFPFIFLSDWLKASLVSYMTTKIEDLQKQTQELKSVRSKVESFDIKNAELLQRSGKGAMSFTQARWEALTVKIQGRLVLSDLITRSKLFFAFMQRNFVFTVLIDCALANLIAVGKIAAGDIFVFSRAIEDAVDMVLTRSRSEAELARMMTEIDKLQELVDIWKRSKDRNLLPCILDSPEKHTVVIRNLQYSRGTASVRADHAEFPPGVYALTGANGSGKSTLFRILMSCSTNEEAIDLPPSINLHTPAAPLTEEDDILREAACVVEADDETDDAAATTCESTTSGDESCASDFASETNDRIVAPHAPSEMPHHVPKLSIYMPSSLVVEISQTFYWPLYTKPIDWIYEEHASGAHRTTDPKDFARLVAEELHSLDFFQGPDEDDEVSDEASLSNDEKTIQTIHEQITEEKEDWFSDLSGGQKSKVELVRKVFLYERCPGVLLVDETMAPLDPASKAVVMAKIKAFCAESIIIVIYHTDVGQGKDVDGEKVECVPSNDFFDRNIHLDKGLIHIRETC